MTKDKDKRFHICQGYYTNPETQEEIICPIQSHCKRFRGNYKTVEDVLELLGYKNRVKSISLYKPKIKPNRRCMHYVPLDSSFYIKGEIGLEELNEDRKR